MSLRLIAGLLLAAVAGLATAQGNSNAEPQVETADTGTTIIGERESPIGLYITPWRNAAPEKELDRPARFLDEVLMPLDPEVFRRQLEYYNTISDHLGSRTSAAPASR